jgi:hypothetical protein
MKQEVINTSRAVIVTILSSYGFPFKERKIGNTIVITVYFYVSDMTDGEPVLTFYIRDDGQVFIYIDSGCLYLEPYELCDVKDVFWDIAKRLKNIYVIHRVCDP